MARGFYYCRDDHSWATVGKCYHMSFGKCCFVAAGSICYVAVESCWIQHGCAPQSANLACIWSYH